MRCLKDGLTYHVQAIKAGFTLSTFVSNQLIHLYSRNGLLRDAEKLFDEMPDRNVFSWNAIISAYIKSPSLTRAREMFDAASDKDMVTYNSVLSAYTNTEGYEAQALAFFHQMQRVHDWIQMDEFTVTTMLTFSTKLSNLCYGQQLHSFMVKTANDRSGFAVSSLVDMYSKCGCFEAAVRVFFGCDYGVNLFAKNAVIAACCREGDIEMAFKVFWMHSELNDAVSWNTLISAYQHNGYHEESLQLFVDMSESGVEWNEHSFGCVLNAISALQNLNAGKEIHAWVLKRGLYSNPFIACGIVDVYCKCGKMNYAELVHLASGKANTYSVCSLIAGHSSQGNMAEAQRLFDSLDDRNSAVWTALFCGYLKALDCESIFQLLKEFRNKENTVPDPLVLVTVLGAAALQAALDLGKQAHCYILRMHIPVEEKMASALIDMYCKCGYVQYADTIFQKFQERDSVLYNIMIAGYANNGRGDKAVKLFEDMMEQGISPDKVTFVALLSACRHHGLVALGEKYFSLMTENFDIVPDSNHYACMIDLYGRAKELDRAVEFMNSIPVEHDGVILGAFLNACRVKGNAELAKEAEAELLRIESGNGARYVQVANGYAERGEWGEMVRIRKQMKVKEAKRLAGCSWLYVGNGVNVFTSGDAYHSNSEAVCSTLRRLTEDLSEKSVILLANE